MGSKSHEIIICFGQHGACRCSGALSCCPDYFLVICNTALQGQKFCESHLTCYVQNTEFWQGSEKWLQHDLNVFDNFLSWCWQNQADANSVTLCSMLTAEVCSLCIGGNKEFCICATRRETVCGHWGEHKHRTDMKLSGGTDYGHSWFCV